MVELFCKEKISLMSFVAFEKSVIERGKIK